MLSYNRNHIYKCYTYGELIEMRIGLESSWVEQTSFLRHSTAKRSIHSLSECEYCAYYKYCNENTFEQNSMAWRVKKTNGSTFPGFTRLQDAFSNWTNSLNQTRLHRDIRKSELEIRHETVTTFMLTNCKWIYMEILLSMKKYYFLPTHKNESLFSSIIHSEYEIL